MEFIKNRKGVQLLLLLFKEKKIKQLEFLLEDILNCLIVLKKMMFN